MENCRGICFFFKCSCAMSAGYMKVDTANIQVPICKRETETLPVSES